MCIIISKHKPLALVRVIYIIKRVVEKYAVKLREHVLTCDLLFAILSVKRILKSFYTENSH
jgi:hypothetical protein